jgi:hypothetical protein
MWLFFAQNPTTKGGVTMQKVSNNLIFTVNTNDVLKSLSLRIDVSTLSPDEIAQACQEVQAAIEHHLDIREYIEIGLDSWEVIRNL